MDDDTLDFEESEPSLSASSLNPKSNKGLSTKGSTYAAPSVGTSMIGSSMIGSSLVGSSMIGSSIGGTSVIDSDYTSRDGGVRISPLQPTSGNSQTQQRAYSDYDSEDDDHIVAEGYSENGK
jgi:hypothetical protein